MVSESDATRPSIPLSGDLDPERQAQRLESIGRLAGGVAHDFNNVLGVILGYVELARMQLGPDHAAAREHLAAALGTLDRARALTARLLAFVRGSPQDQNGRLDPNAVVSDLCDLLAETLDRRVTIRVSLANDAPWVDLERERLAHALLNLCLDAAERMPEGGVLTLDVRRSEIQDRDAPVLPGRYARFDVRDSNVGAELPDPRGGDPLPRGLDVARELADEIGGALTIVGDEAGNLLSFWIPAVQDVDRPIIERDASVRGTILVVDDEPGVREVTRAHLEHAGYAVREAGTAERAIDLVRAAPEAFDVVLLDLHLPDAPGTDVVAALESTSPSPALVIVTGDPEWADAAELPPETTRLDKPFLRAGLLDAVRRASGAD